MATVAVIDLGTVTERLAIAQVDGGEFKLLEKRSTIVNVGVGVDETHRLDDEAIARAAEAAAGYVERISDYEVDAVCCTMTSAARDAENAAELIGATEGLGWYVKNFSDFADYGKVIVGIIFIGLVITAITAVFKRIERYLLRYKEAGQ